MLAAEDRPTHPAIPHIQSKDTAIMCLSDSWSSFETYAGVARAIYIHTFLVRRR